MPPYEYAHPDDLLDRAAELGEVPLVVALDGVTDPRNLGAVVRSVGRLRRSRRASCPSAAPRDDGLRVEGLGRCGGAGAGRPGHQPDPGAGGVPAGRAASWSGLDADGDLELADLEAATEPLVLVVGSEGRGLSRLVRQTCDVVVSIPMAGEMESLNAGVAAGIALYDVARRRAAARA